MLPHHTFDGECAYCKNYGHAIAECKKRMKAENERGRMHQLQKFFEENKEEYEQYLQYQQQELEQQQQQGGFFGPTRAFMLKARPSVSHLQHPVMQQLQQLLPNFDAISSALPLSSMLAYTDLDSLNSRRITMLSGFLTYMHQQRLPYADKMVVAPFKSLPPTEEGQIVISLDCDPNFLHNTVSSPSKPARSTLGNPKPKRGV